LGWCLRGEDAAARLRAMAEPSNRRIHSWHWLNKHVLARCHAAESTKAQVKVSGGVGGWGPWQGSGRAISSAAANTDTTRGPLGV